MLQIHVKTCADPSLWYAKHIGRVVTFVRDANDGKNWLSRDNEGHLNVIRKADSELIVNQDVLAIESAQLTEKAVAALPDLACFAGKRLAIRNARPEFNPGKGVFEVLFTVDVSGSRHYLYAEAMERFSVGSAEDATETPIRHVYLPAFSTGGSSPSCVKVEDVDSFVTEVHRLQLICEQCDIDEAGVKLDGVQWDVRGVSTNARLTVTAGMFWLSESDSAGFKLQTPAMHVDLLENCVAQQTGDVFCTKNPDALARQMPAVAALANQ